MSLKISIVTTCLNEYTKIENTLKSVIFQTYPNFEYIVIDGGSTDGTVKLISKYKDKLFYYVSETDNGIYDAMNKGAKIATGDYLLFLNAGDYFISNNSLSDFSVNLGKHNISFGNIVSKDFKKPSSNDPRLINIDTYLSYSTPPHQASFIMRSMLEKCNYYDTSFKIAGDYDFFLKARSIQHATFSYHNIDVSYFDNSGLSSKVENEHLMKKEVRRIWKRYFTFIKFLYLSTWQNNILLIRYFVRVYFYVRHLIHRYWFK